MSEIKITLNEREFFNVTLPDQIKPNELREIVARFQNILKVYGKDELIETAKKIPMNIRTRSDSKIKSKEEALNALKDYYLKIDGSEFYKKWNFQRSSAGYLMKTAARFGISKDDIRALKQKVNDARTIN